MHVNFKCVRKYVRVCRFLMLKGYHKCSEMCQQSPAEVALKYRESRLIVIIIKLRLGHTRSYENRPK